ncbi:Type 1 glutamine amidotransferase-like domain-containing protein [Corynebacterium tuberculostearicum]|uniref:Type 1 glutamine amidotransferase-like domain-containing protein n=1 Tax=Corynebacterium tuberculostearicum TaxID=38304 RepID=UPI002026C036|nr:Type 1 glutamine amidotransferase-like domain-containing protein [Corynebacterium tuberculostearicum]MCG7459826.1 Type 1 glutamine amidotransferase-like domain-containing protein [Corynebacterium tuberculostearicum]MDK8677948.1 Type 1 glutamine amidotransferase-like domain-containing protein [Corynebacterium tuberculostearicum]
MKLLLASFLHPDIGDYISGRVLYIDDAASEMRQAPFAQAELKAIGEAAETLVPLTLSQSNSSDLQNEIASANCIYVASGEVFRLLNALRSTGADRLLTDAVNQGKLYAGSSAGAIIAGPSIEPASIMDDPKTAPQLTDYTGLNLTPHVIVPHAQGTTGPYSIEVISKTVETYGREWNLLLLRDGQALFMDDEKSILI